MSDAALPALDTLIACPHCDALHRLTPLAMGERADCARCGQQLIAPRKNAFLLVSAMGMTIAILMLGAVFHPFLSVSLAGITRNASIFDAVLIFSSGALLPVTVLTFGFIVLIPVLRASALIYVLVPLVLGRPPRRLAKPAMRAAEFLKPWSMAEIFIISVAVALVKVAGLASVHFGTAFWYFVALVVVVALQDLFMCEHTIWDALERSETP
jgi:paraquat-inducible protein A